MKKGGCGQLPVLSSVWLSVRLRRATVRAPPPAAIRTAAPPISHGVASAPVWAREPVGVFGVESPTGVAAMAEVSVSGVSLSVTDGVALSVPLFGLPGLEEGVSVGVCVGLPEGSGFGVVVVLALVTVTVTGSPGAAVNVLVGLYRS